MMFSTKHATDIFLEWRGNGNQPPAEYLGTVKGLKQQRSKGTQISLWFGAAATAEELELVSKKSAEEGARRKVAACMENIVRQRLKAEFAMIPGKKRVPCLEPGKEFSATTLKFVPELEPTPQTHHLIFNAPCLKLIMSLVDSCCWKLPAD